MTRPLACCRSAIPKLVDPNPPGELEAVNSPLREVTQKWVTTAPWSLWCHLGTSPTPPIIPLYTPLLYTPLLPTIPHPHQLYHYILHHYILLYCLWLHKGNVRSNLSSQISRTLNWDLWPNLMKGKADMNKMVGFFVCIQLSLIQYSHKFTKAHINCLNVTHAYDIQNYSKGASRIISITTPSP